MAIRWDVENIGTAALMALPTFCSFYFKKDGLAANPVVLSAILSQATYMIPHTSSYWKAHQTVEWSNYFLIGCTLLRTINGTKFLLHGVIDSCIIVTFAFASNPNAFNTLAKGPLVVFKGKFFPNKPKEE